MKRFTLCIVAVLSLTVSSRAGIPMSEFINSEMAYTEVMYGSINQNFTVQQAFTSRLNLAKWGDTSIYIQCIDNAIGSSLVVDNYDPETCTLTIRNKQISAYQKDYVTRIQHISPEPFWDNDGQGWDYPDDNTPTQGTVEKLNDDFYRITIPWVRFDYLDDQGQNITYAVRKFSRIEIYCFRKNASIYHRYFTSSVDMDTRTSPAYSFLSQPDAEGSRVCRLLNFGGVGVHYKVELQENNRPVQTEFYIPEILLRHDGKAIVGPLNQKTLAHGFTRLAEDGQSYTISPFTPVCHQVKYYAMPDPDDLTNRNPIIEGDWRLLLHHNEGDNGWVTNDGPRRTIRDQYLITLPRYGRISVDENDEPLPLYGEEEGNYQTMRSFHEDTRITIPYEPEDVTCEPELKIISFQQNIEDGNHYLDIHYAVRGGTSPVDFSHQLCIMPGAHSSVLESGFANDPAKGHALGADLTSNCSQIETYTDSEGYTHTTIRTPKSALAFEYEDGTVPVTFYLKTTYAPEAGLTPTFHSMVPQNVFLTSVDTPDYQTGTLGVISGHGSLTVSSDSAVEIYNTAGSQVYSGAAGTVSLPTGIYLVRSGAHTLKATVR